MSKQLSSKLQEKFKNKEYSFDGKYFVCEGKKYTEDGLKVIAENMPVVFNCVEMKIVESKKDN